MNLPPPQSRWRKLPWNAGLQGVTCRRRNLRSHQHFLTSELPIKIRIINNSVRKNWSVHAMLSSKGQRVTCYLLSFRSCSMQPHRRRPALLLISQMETKMKIKQPFVVSVTVSTYDKTSLQIHSHNDIGAPWWLSEDQFKHRKIKLQYIPSSKAGGYVPRKLRVLWNRTTGA